MTLKKVGELPNETGGRRQEKPSYWVPVEDQLETLAEVERLRRELNESIKDRELAESIAETREAEVARLTAERDTANGAAQDWQKQAFEEAASAEKAEAELAEARRRVGELAAKMHRWSKVLPDAEEIVLVDGRKVNSVQAEGAFVAFEIAANELEAALRGPSDERDMAARDAQAQDRDE